MTSSLAIGISSDSLIFIANPHTNGIRRMSEDEKLLPLVDAIEQETGQKVHLTTAQRWCREGRYQCHLRFQQFGGRMMTKRIWIRDFIEVCTQATAPATEPQAKTASQRKREVHAAKRKLDELLG